MIHHLITSIKTNWSVPSGTCLSHSPDYIVLLSLLRKRGVILFCERIYLMKCHKSFFCFLFSNLSFKTFCHLINHQNCCCLYSCMMLCLSKLTEKTSTSSNNRNSKRAEQNILINVFYLVDLYFL